MSHESLSAAALHVVDRYNLAGKTLLSAWRSGAHRLLDGAATGTARLLDAPRAQVSADARSRLLDTQRQVNGFLARRLDIDSGRVEAVMDRVADASSSGIEAAASRAAQIDSPVAVRVRDTFKRVNLPIANVSVRIAEHVADGAQWIDARVAGASATPVVRTVKPRVVRGTHRKD